MRDQKTPAELLVGLDVADDAAVYLVARDTAIVETLDLSPNSTSPPYAYTSDIAFAGTDRARGVGVVDDRREEVQRLDDRRVARNEVHAASSATSRPTSSSAGVF